MPTINNSQDYMNSLDIIEYHDDLADDIEVLAKLTELAGKDAAEDEISNLAELKDEFNPLHKFVNKAENNIHWEYGITVIRNDYFEEYAKELAEDIDAINRDAHWPNNFINWEAAANALKIDYTCIDFDGVNYWMRS